MCFGFVSFVEYFEALPFLLLVNCSLALHSHCFESLNYFVLHGQGEVKGISIVQVEIFMLFCPSFSRCHIPSAHLTPT
jgi:hypothetical protein